MVCLMRLPSIPRPWRIGIAVAYVFVFLYSVIVMQQLLLGIALPALVLVSAYLGWRLWRVFRMHEQRLEAEAEVESSEDHDENQTIEELKTEYATGHLTEDEFEAELERLLEAESSSHWSKSSEEVRATETERTE